MNLTRRLCGRWDPLRAVAGLDRRELFLSVFFSVQSRRALGGRGYPECGASVIVQMVQCQAPEDVVHDRLCHPDVPVVRESGWLKSKVGELLHVGRQWDSVLQADGHRNRESVHHPCEGGTLLAQTEEDLTGPVVRVGTH